MVENKGYDIEVEGKTYVLVHETDAKGRRQFTSCSKCVAKTDEMCSKLTSVQPTPVCMVTGCVWKEKE